MKHDLLTLDHLIQIKVERGALNPFHEEDGESILADEDSFRAVLKVGKCRDRVISQVSLDCTISLVAISEVTTEAPDGEVTTRRFEFINVGKLAGSDQWHS